MPKRAVKKVRSLVLATFSAITALFGAVTSALAGSIGGPFP
jgi:hypothetical protein